MSSYQIIFASAVSGLELCLTCQVITIDVVKGTAEMTLPSEMQRLHEDHVQVKER